MTQLVKMDLKDAHRMVSINPHDRHLMADARDGNIFVDRCLLFGLRSALNISMKWLLWLGCSTYGDQVFVPLPDDFYLLVFQASIKYSE